MINHLATMKPRARRDDVIRRMINTPPQPHKPKHRDFSGKWGFSSVTPSHSFGFNGLADFETVTPLSAVTV
jgi:hypothetical protein